MELQGMAETVTGGASVSGGAASRTLAKGRANGKAIHFGGAIRMALR